MTTSTSPVLEHTTRIVPAFYDIDVMEVVWHGHYVKYLEVARGELLERYDYNYPQMRASGYAWPIVDMKLKYVRSATLGQPLDVRARIVEWENRLRIDYLITDAATGRKLTQAQTTQVAVDIATRSMCYVCPPVLSERLGVTPA